MFLMASVSYLGREAQPSFLLVYLALGGVILFFIFNLLVAIAGIWLYTARAQRILRQRYHHQGETWRQHRVFGT